MSKTSAFSMYGYLDVSADTQWVRITPVREQVATPDEIPEMEVTLLHVESGNEVIMKDSLFNIVGGFNAVNVYSSEMDIEPEQTYIIKTERPDGATSQVTVSIPPDYPTPVLTTGGAYDDRGDLFLKGVERVADVTSIWEIDGLTYYVPNRSFVREYSPPGYDYFVGISSRHAMSWIFGEDAPPPYAVDILQQRQVRRQIFIASGGPEWLESIANFEDQIYGLPQEVSNVENGVGYVIGIVSKTIPFKTCHGENGELTACPVEKPFWR
ncbi:MAG: hypothetical protein R3220_02035 [Balneolaceae bacterium]|nr:hypothetical protein [Balneolaceae bacterium]